jgi:hypothetical protein
VAEHVRGEVKADPRPGALDDVDDVGVAHRAPDLAAPQIHEHVVGIQVAVLGVHVVRVAAHQLAADRDRPLAALAARAVGVVLARDDLDAPLVRDEVRMTQAQRLADPHPGPEQQPEQEPVAQPVLGVDDRANLLERERRRQPPALPQPTDPATRLSTRDPMQERLVAAAARPGLIDQHLGDLDTMRAWKS